MINFFRDAKQVNLLKLKKFQKIKFLQCQYGTDRGKPSPGESKIFERHQKPLNLNKIEMHPLTYLSISFPACEERKFNSD